MRTEVPSKSYVQVQTRERSQRREHGKIDRLMRAPSGRVFKIDPRAFSAHLTFGWKFLGDD